jgi:SAM-dependent methyltransferase
MPIGDDMNSGQSTNSAEANASYFLDHLREYKDAVANIDTYRTLHDFISREVAGTDALLDIGNGGVFDYDTTKVGSITAIDLFFEGLPTDLLAQYFPKNAQAKQGSALALPEPDNRFDMVLMVMVLHHLTGMDWRQSWTNACKAIDEAWRVLRPGGRLLIVESCVPEWFFFLEKPAVRVVSYLTKTILSHPVTMQFPVAMIADQFRKKTGEVRVTNIPKGKHILQFGVKVPAVLTPVQLFAIEATKAS